MPCQGGGRRLVEWYDGLGRLCCPSHRRWHWPSSSIWPTTSSGFPAFLTLPSSSLFAGQAVPGRGARGGPLRARNPPQPTDPPHPAGVAAGAAALDVFGDAAAPLTLPLLRSGIHSDVDPTHSPRSCSGTAAGWQKGYSKPVLLTGRRPPRCERSAYGSGSAGPAPTDPTGTVVAGLESPSPSQGPPIS